MIRPFIVLLLLLVWFVCLDASMILISKALLILRLTSKSTLHKWERRNPSGYANGLMANIQPGKIRDPDRNVFDKRKENF